MCGLQDEYPPREVHPRDQYKTSPMKTNPFQGTSSYQDAYTPHKLPDHRGAAVPASPPKHVPFEGQSESHEVSHNPMSAIATLEGPEWPHVVI